jgi:hypothetical protein
MVTSKLMRRAVLILLALVLLTGGFCNSLCFARAAHSCCDEQNHCGHAGPVLQSHQAVAIPQITPAILTTPVLSSPAWLVASDPLIQLYPVDFSPPIRTSVLRL